MNIGQAAVRSGVSAKMIRYYEEIGLISASSRSQAGYRVFAESDIHRMRFVRRARDLGFSIADIQTLLALWDDRTRQSGEVKRLAVAQVAALRRKITELEAMAGTLEHLAANCAGDHRPACPILNDLAAEPVATRGDERRRAKPD
jgi:MerR family transcriptional regulator, copper efflux regulator